MSDDTILLSHGSGGAMMARLIEDVFVATFDNPTLRELGDSAVVGAEAGRLAFTTDAFIITPIFFPGGDIGHLSVCGTVNDLAAAGARPLHLSAAFIIEEGLPLSDLKRVVASMKATADEAKVAVVAGDTKVVPHGAADRMFIATAGIGVVPEGVSVSPAGARVGDAVLINGPIADHGLAVLCAREGIELETSLESDSAPLGLLVGRVLEAAPDTHCLRDPTRGGVAAALNEIAERSGACIELEEAALPVREAARGACEVLGLDPLHVANEGKMLAIVPEAQADGALEAMRRGRYGGGAARIGRVVEGPAGRVQLRTVLGTRRIVDRPVGEPMPRIC
jgi:hydrogenase expression/formation protein HypE